MAIVNEKHQSAKPVQVDPKTGKPLPAALQKDTPTSQSLDNMPNEGGFFGSFFATKNKKKLAQMEPPPPVLKASGTLSERETIETEVISTKLLKNHSLIIRTIDLFIFQYRKEDDDRHGPQGHHA
jgi:vacuolar protein sorting-associated protein 1